MRYLRRTTKDGNARYHIYPGDVEYNGYSYLGPALVDGEPVNLNHAHLADAKQALQRLHTDPTKRNWVIYDFLSSRKVPND